MAEAKKRSEEEAARDPEIVWLDVCNDLDVKGVPLGESNPKENEKYPRSRSEWRTIRIFVSSTFTDFHFEREVLVKEVFQDLRLWCQKRRLKLIDIDLRWGVPDNTPMKDTVELCLKEIDRCTKENIMPYFINLTSVRTGEVPKEGIDKLLKEYGLVYGLSVTEMEIIHGAYKNNNPNSIFLIRDLDDYIINKLAELKMKDRFVEDTEKSLKKREELKRRILERFNARQIVSYQCKFIKLDEDSQKPVFEFSPKDVFTKTVLDFFMERIESQYPILETPEDPYKKIRMSHEAFMKNKSSFVLGREDLLKEITEYIDGVGVDMPLLLLGDAGCGKSALMAKAVEQTIERAEKGQIPGEGKDKRWHVFYHFVGAVPDSTKLHAMLTRLLIELDIFKEDTSLKDFDTTVKIANSALKNPDTPSVIIMVDAINQFDNNTQSELVSWLPQKLSPRVRCVLSMIPGTPQHRNLESRSHKPQMCSVGPLTKETAKTIANTYLNEYNKTLSPKEMSRLETKRSFTNPLWLTVACEELRIYGVFRKKVADSEAESGFTYVYMIMENIKNFKDDLLGLLGQVLRRFQQDGDPEESRLLVATMCLLEVSETGLLEDELLELLADEENLLPSQSQEKGKSEKSDKFQRLPPMKWAKVWRKLGPFLRPFGDGGKGRLDFYHRSVSKVVRKDYLQNDGTPESLQNQDYMWWHKKLADYFYDSSDYERKTEELPIHLIRLKDFKRLCEFLTEWETFDELFDKDLSSRLLSYWHQCGDKDLRAMRQCYCEQVSRMEEIGKIPDKELAQKQLQLGWLMLQIEELDTAADLAKKALVLENSGDKDPEKMADVYSLLADISSKRVKQRPQVCDEQYPDAEDCARWNTEAIEQLKHITREPHTERSIQTLIGKRYIQLAFNMDAMDQIRGTDAIAASGRTCQDECQFIIKKAKEIFKQLGDNGILAEATMIEAKALWRKADVKKQPKLYQEAWDLSYQTYGRLHILSARIQYNWGIAYKKLENFAEAYVHFKESYLIKCDVQGLHHNNTVRTREMMGRSEFKKFHNEKKLDEEIKNMSSY